MVGFMRRKLSGIFTGTRQSRLCGYFLLFVILGSLVYFHLQSSPSKGIVVVSHFGESSKCWVEPKPFRRFEPDETVLRNSTGNEDGSICKRQKRLLTDPLIHKCSYGNEVLDAGDCVMQGTKIVRCLPSFIVAGAMKSGTGALLRWLKRHPHLQAGKGPDGQNEMHFFGQSYADSTCPWSSYVALFPPMTKLQARTSYTFDKSPDYMRDLVKLQQLHTIAPSSRIIIIIRNPTSRAYSGFFHNCRHERFYRVVNPIIDGTHGESKVGFPKGLVGRIDEAYAPEGTVFRNGDKNSALRLIEKGDCTATDFHRYVYGDDPRAPSMNVSAVDTTRNSYLDMYIGHYDEQLANIYSLFPPDRVLVLFQEHMDRGTLPTLRRIEKFLGLPKYDYGENNFLVTRNGDEGIGHVWNEYRKTHLQVSTSGKSKSSGMFAVTKERLDAFYAPHNTRLRDMLVQHNALSPEFPFPSTWPVINDAPLAVRVGAPLP